MKIKKLQLIIISSLFLGLVFFAFGKIASHAKGEVKAIIYSERKKTDIRTENHNSCLISESVYVNDDLFVQESTKKVSLNTKETKDLLRESKKSFATKKRITELPEFALDLSFLTDEPVTPPPVTDSLLKIRYVIHIIRNENIVKKIILGADDIIRIDDKYFRVDKSELRNMASYIEKISN